MIVSWALVWGILGLPKSGNASEYVVYSVYRALDLGNPGEGRPPKEYFVNAGTTEGVQKGAILQVFRKSATYDLLTEKLYKDVTIPVARLKVIHSESGAAVARLESVLAIEQRPFVTSGDVMIGDIVRLSQ
ncbi:MAG: hypothetical protein A2X94_14610 [Bdellovibrionales bacterium GWB1_55_8]|nr:MAG: hypothetical protein A2X94_14610 [Bdellovibrionales bacterium GWB1_55_8]